MCKAPYSENHGRPAPGGGALLDGLLDALLVRFRPYCDLTIEEFWRARAMKVGARAKKHPVSLQGTLGFLVLLRVFQ